MRVIGSFLLALLVLASAATPSQAATLYIDAFAPGGIPGTGGPVTPGLCTGGSCAPDGYQTAAYIVEAGDIVNFGSVTLYSSVFCDFRSGPFTRCGLYRGDYSVSFTASEAFTIPRQVGLCNPFETTCEPPNPLSNLVTLSFVVPESATRIQVAWTGPYSYTPPVPTPLPGALPLFASALCLVGAGAWVRRRSVTSQAIQPSC